ncbi:hypothetical protein PHAVU_006G069400 [Phaseolus vulgaris]|uniref:Neprosin activation peptide domain-containing protein n=1 Tax=Phaseolus vulgaris TaxID=3885 RepID=V7BNZ7_PHAVU|nr:hypothetical protein PHAVU_006G069400g [Phaseolus vulgaris]ESW18775.1 hypothetical protein PHAVU_006G069400g [Phaseolus vulgaris]
MAASRFLLLCFVFAFAVPCFGRAIPTDTEKNNPLPPSMEQDHQLLDEEDRVIHSIQPRVKFSENSEVKIEGLDLDYTGAHNHPCPPDHCPPGQKPPSTV